jgi:CDP-diacylglycerol---glycerol-3-phosphate 3-phosphatidyltransferase
VSAAALPNSLTLLRLGLSPLLGYLVAVDRRQAFCLLAGALLLTDALDGFLARALAVASDFGRRLDTYADWVFYPFFGLGGLCLLRGFFSAHRLLTGALLVLLVAPPLLGLARWRRILPLHLTTARLQGVIFGVFLLAGLWLRPSLALAYLLLAVALVRTVEESAVIFLLGGPEEAGVRSLAELLRRRRPTRPMPPMPPPLT